MIAIVRLQAGTANGSAMAPLSPKVQRWRHEQSLPASKEGRHAPGLLPPSCNLEPPKWC
jgi:hypothetical protein